MLRWCVAMTLLAACGRVGFDARTDAGDTDAGLDASPVRSADFDVDFIGGMLGSFTFTRASTASYMNADREMRYAAVDEPRFDHVPATGQPRGLLIEGAATNLIFYSDQLDAGADWFTNEIVNGSLTVTPDAEFAPDGTMSAELLDEADSTNNTRRAQIVTIANDSFDYVCSVFLKQGTSAVRTIGCELLNGANVQTGMDVDLSTGTITSPPPLAEAYGMTKYPFGWWRVWITLRNNMSGNTIGVLSIWDYRTDPTVNGSVYAWGAQFETGSGPTSYIPNPTNTPATRAADNASTTELAWLDPTTGSMLVSAEIAVVHSRSQHAACFPDEGGGQTCVSRYGPSGSAALLYGGTPLIEGTFWTGQPSSVLIVQNTPQLSFHDPGGVRTVTSPPAGAPYTALVLGSDATQWFDGWIRRFAYWREHLTSEERTSLGVK